MKNLLITFAILFQCSLYAQSVQDVSVELSATVQAFPPAITLSWTPNASAEQHFVYRKLKNGNAWGAVIGALPGNATGFVDTTVTPGISYEYRVLRTATAFTGNGYINAGIEIPAIEYRGILILVVDSTFSQSLSAEIARLRSDMEGDGWIVKQINVLRNAQVTDVKSMIVDIYQDDPANTKAVFLLGRVPVPYSGEVNVDGHTDHTGAYPADVYYAEMNGLWSDAVTNNITAGDPRNHNVPEDGKFDQSFIPNDIDLQIGRVDFFNMPSFAASEEELLRNYLNKDHAYRHKEIVAAYRAVIDDNFGYFGGEAFASSGYKNAAPLVGHQNIAASDYFTTMRDSSYLWSYGCGGGWYQGAGGVGSTTDFANANLKSVFTMLFGSYFGDWDTQDNFLRAALAQGWTLTNVWSGRPHWQFHHMGLGENIGYDVRVSQNNNGLYFANFAGRVVHMAFMGDPTLRNDVVAPVSSVLASSINGEEAIIQWTASPDAVLGYHVYMRGPGEESFTKINDELITTTHFTHLCLADAGVYDVMVRAVTLQVNSSGTYYNLSQGIRDTVWSPGIEEVVADAIFNVNGDIVSFSNQSMHADEYLWIFGDGATSTEVNPVHDYVDGDFTVTLIAKSACDADTVEFLVSILTSVEGIDQGGVTVYPNPATDKIYISCETGTELKSFALYTSEGRMIRSGQISGGQQELNLLAMPAGNYTLIVNTDKGRVIRKLSIGR